MAVPLEGFWSKESDYGWHNRPLTQELLELAQQKLGINLPAEYLELLWVQNGGYTRGFGYPMSRKTSWAADHVPLHDMSGIADDPSGHGSFDILNTAYMTREWGLPQGLVLLSGDGHWWIALDYRLSNEPSIVWIDVEFGEDVQVAPSFAAFLDGLRPSESFER